MAAGHEVLSLLIPTGGWVIRGDNFEDIEFIEATPITKAQFEAGFATCDAQKIKQEAEKAKTKQALLDKLGITADEVAALLS